MELIENFFTDDECNNALKEVDRNQDLWTRCQETHMYILGNSLLRTQKLEHKGKKDYTSLYLSKNIYNFETSEILRKKLSDIFFETKFCKHLSQPGFQIVKRNESERPSVWHYDDIIMSYPFDLDFPDYENNFYEYFEDFYIFTLMLSEGESSFDYFPETDSKYTTDDNIETPICKEHINLVGDCCVNPNCSLKNFQTINYTKGSLLIQKNERMLHRVGNRDIDGQDSFRITITAYGLVKNNIMYIFW